MARQGLVDSDRIVLGKEKQHQHRPMQQNECGRNGGTFKYPPCLSVCLYLESGGDGRSVRRLLHSLL